MIAIPPSMVANLVVIVLKRWSAVTVAAIQIFAHSIPKKRKPKKLNTAEMWLKAQENGKQYRAKDVLYSKATGLVKTDNFKHPWSIMAWVRFNTDKDAVRHEIDELMNEQWEEVKIPTMTKAEAEAKLGVKIVD